MDIVICVFIVLWVTAVALGVIKSLQFSDSAYFLSGLLMPLVLVGAYIALIKAILEE